MYTFRGPEEVQNLKEALQNQVILDERKIIWYLFKLEHHESTCSKTEYLRNGLLKTEHEGIIVGEVWRVHC